MLRIWTFVGAWALIVCVGVSARAELGASPSPSPEPSSSDLKMAVIKAASQLGPLDPMQKRIFDEEVLPQYALFIRDYKKVGQSTDVQLDLDSIRNIVHFSAQKDLNQPSAKILLYLNIDPHCPKCVEESPGVHRDMQLRAERRGFSPVWIAQEELTGSTLSDLMGPRGTVGFVQMDLIPAPADDVDTAHADEKRFLAKIELQVRGISAYHDQAELFDTDSFETEGAKLLTHAFSDLGAKADLVSVGTATKDDILIEVGKITSFAQYSRLKGEIQTRLKGVAVLEERKISRGHAVFVVRTKKTVNEVKALLSGIDSSVQMEIK